MRETDALSRLSTQTPPAPADTGPGFSPTGIAARTEPARGSITATELAGTLTGGAPPRPTATATAIAAAPATINVPSSVRARRERRCPGGRGGRRRAPLPAARPNP